MESGRAESHAAAAKHFSESFILPRHIGETPDSPALFLQFFQFMDHIRYRDTYKQSRYKQADGEYNIISGFICNTQTDDVARNHRRPDDGQNDKQHDQNRLPQKKLVVLLIFDCP